MLVYLIQFLQVACISCWAFYGVIINVSVGWDGNKENDMQTFLYHLPVDYIICVILWPYYVLRDFWLITIEFTNQFKTVCAIPVVL